MPVGGKRQGAGRRTDFTTQEKAEFFKAAAEIFSVDAPQDMPALYQVLRDMAGIGSRCRVLAKVKWDGRRRILFETEEEFEASDGSPLFVYTLKPDLAAIKFLMEKTTGKAAQQAQQTVDTTINLLIDPAIRPIVRGPDNGPSGRKA